MTPLLFLFIQIAVLFQGQNITESRKITTAIQRSPTPTHTHTHTSHINIWNDLRNKFLKIISIGIDNIH